MSKSSISCEIERNSAGGKYEAEEAHRRYLYKKGQRVAYRLTDSVKIAERMSFAMSSFSIKYLKVMS